MAIKLKFDMNNIVQSPTFVLTTRSGRKLGSIPAENITFSDDMKEHEEGFFSIHKEKLNSNSSIWDKIKDLKLLYCPEWNSLFQMSVEIDQSDELIKNVSFASLGKSELSQVNLYNIEINTEKDIEREEYNPTIFYNEEKHSASLLHRILDKVPHYRIAHVDPGLVNIQRTFSFNEKNIFDAFQEISEEINCVFRVEVGFNSDNKIERNIYVYDLESYCLDRGCNHRSEFSTACPICGSMNYLHGYGKDTTIFISTENLADDIQYSTDIDSVKNCYKLNAGDELMTATVINCNPNGSDYIWHINNDMREDMSDELVSKLTRYDFDYLFYRDYYPTNISKDIIAKYNNLVSRYSPYCEEELYSLPDEIVGHINLARAYYDSIDFQLLLEKNMMPSAKLQSTSARRETNKLTAKNIGSIAVTSYASDATASNAALSVVKSLIDPRYQIKVESGVISDGNWIGNFVLTNYYDDEDTAVSQKIALPITNDLETFLRQKINKLLSKQETEAIGITALFKLAEEENEENLQKFCNELKRYSLARLVSFSDSCQACLNVLIEQGVADQGAWKNLYDSLYSPYYRRLEAIQAEIKVREEDIKIITGVYGSDGLLVSEGLQTAIKKEIDMIHKTLNYEDYLGESLWLEFIAYRREDTYSNDTFISDGLSNSELIENAIDFINSAEKEIVKANTMQHSISATFKNLLVMKEFRPIVDHFEIGNWIRVKIDNSIYKLRLTKYKIDFSNTEKLEVEFSDVTATQSGSTKAKNILAKSAAVTSTYKQVSQKAEQGKRGNQKITELVNNGISVSSTKIVGSTSDDNMTWSSNGMLFKNYDDISDDYEDSQFKITNSTFSMTDDNWENVKTVLGKFYVPDGNGNYTCLYGVNVDALIGELILGERLWIRNKDGSLTFDTNGLSISDIEKRHMVLIDPNDPLSILRVKNGESDILSFDSDGDLNIKGKITVKSIDFEDGASVSSGNVDGLSTVALTGRYEDLYNLPTYHNIAKTGQYSDLEGLPDLSGIEKNSTDITENTNSIDKLTTLINEIQLHIDDLTSRITALESV